MQGHDSVRQRATDAEDVKDGVRTYRLSYEARLIGRKVDASKRIFGITKILVFDFELFISGRATFVRW